MSTGLHAQQHKDSTQPPAKHTTALHSTPKNIERRGLHAIQRAPSPSAKYTPSDIHTLQQMQGNRAVAQLLQRSLIVGPANDRAEQEADRVAAYVTADRGRTTADRNPQQEDQTRKSLPAAHQSRTGGQPLPAAIRRQMETGFNADFGHVRIHTNAQAASINRALDAEAFTHQNHIYLGEGNTSLASSSGQQLLAHELTHVVQQSAVQRKPNKGSLAISSQLPGNRISTKKKKKKLYLDFLRLKRLDPQFDVIIAKKLGFKKQATAKENASTGTYGHWWTEVGDMKGDYPGKWKPIESYGWWPKNGVSGVKETFKGVDGALNAGSRNDPHHGEAVKPAQMFHPVMELDPTDDYATVRQKVLDDVRKFSKGYSGKWNWVFGWGKNCHTFQQKMNDKVGIHHQKGVGWFKRPNDVEKLSQGVKREQAQAEQEKFNQENPGIDFTLTTDVPVKKGSIMNEIDVDFRLPKGATVRILEDSLMGMSLERIQGFNKIEVMYNGERYVSYKDDIVKHATRV